MLRHTPLFDEHLKLNARMVEFGGWEMPVSYSGIIEEHLAVRNSAGLFDVSHMGVVEVEGAGALPLIQRLTTNDASRLPDFRAQYSVLCNDHGGTIDDVFLYKLPGKFLFIFNASNTDKDLAWFLKNDREGAKITHVKDSCLLSAQGPRAEALLSPLCAAELSKMKRNALAPAELLGRKCLISRTGYTGGDGFEIILSSADAGHVWAGLLARGFLPCGLGARDSLRIEAALPLYGHEYTEDISPIEAGYGWAVKLDKGDFVGKGALAKLLAGAAKRKLVGITLREKAVPRQGFRVFSDDKMTEELGSVTSGTYSPLLGRSIALAYVRPESPAAGTAVHINIRDRAFSGIISEVPFYRKTA